EELKGEMDSKLRVVLAGRFRTLERDAAQTAAQLESVSGELRTLADSGAEHEQEHARLQTACFETEARLRESREKSAELNSEVGPGWKRGRGRAPESSRGSHRARPSPRASTGRWRRSTARSTGTARAWPSSSAQPPRRGSGASRRTRRGRHCRGGSGIARRAS